MLTGIDAMTAVTSSPVLDHLRNDLALLVADDLDAALRAPGTLERPEHPGDRPAGSGGLDTEPADSVDYLVGMWAFSRELVAAVEALAAATTHPAGVIEPAARPPLPDEPLLR